MHKISDYLLTNNNMAHVAIYFLVGLIALFLIFQVLKNLFYRGSNVRGFHFTTKNITYIAMMVAVSTTVTVVISLTLPITVFPPIRIAFEGIMVKIAGMFFGPLVGIIVGLITELITIMFVPSYIHVAYLIVAVGFGFLSGLTSYFQRLTGRKKWWTFLAINLFIIAYGVVLGLITSYYNEDVKLFGVDIAPEYYTYVFIGSIGLSLVLVWVVVGVFLIMKKGYLLDIVLPIILMCVVTEYCVTTLIGSWGDVSFLGIPRDTGGYTSILMVRLLQSPIKIVFNTLVLSTVFYILRPLVKSK
ncbi:ECF transporter S component [Mesoplasma lactucae]|uniref:ECF transporter S component n=1 Tax=Mesoplasma lactucae ATCC 49193 TaxID=81460 RepID=A0A291ISK1_9MOLU|nr:LytS/YhcK type 5TM receptor domain-containing protein [Mesoplasma lactucae]ATG97671.1 hypothetical protein CP520_02945 [Mesoplasma lactucae ATCC 49193]ATZ19864.1 hypothetical protein MLACT_v1c00390 [Mesoplasma lactucae ATCC 49193]MCL8216727.1 hypothetical protein [Mesoplasma lactucae ATCC 49193]